MNDGYGLRDIALLCRFNSQIAQLGKELARRGIRASDSVGRTNGEDSARLLTMHGSKGLEFRGVVIPEPYPKVPAEGEARLLYVAMTRSTESLLVTYHRESDFTRQCERLAAAGH